MSRIVVNIRHWFLEALGLGPGPADEWVVLLKKYTGLMLVVHLVFASIYFLPLLIRLLIMSGTVPGASEEDLLSLKQVLEHDVPVWELLMFGFLGTKSLAGWVAVGLSMAMLAYNLLRLTLTIRVTSLRRAAGHPPPRSYHWMYRIHMPWMYVLFTLSLLYAALRIYDAANLRAIL